VGRAFGLAGVQANFSNVPGGLQGSCCSSTVLDVPNCTPTTCTLTQEFFTKNALSCGRCPSTGKVPVG
jgi:hypothetical protein